MDIGLVQINNSFSGQNYLPYSVACLQSYVQAKCGRERFRFRRPIYKRIAVGQAVDDLRDCAVVGFSTYVWNGRISLEIARRLKAVSPQTMIVFGGPHVPDDSEPFLRANPCVDIAVHNEGEQTFREILEGREWPEVAGVSFVLDGIFAKTKARDRMRDLDQVPSPFLSGVLDEIMSANPDENWIGLWETNRGCPFSCEFCDWGSNTASKLTKFEEGRVKREVDWFSDKQIEYVFCCDANFGIQKRDVDIAQYVADKKRATGYPKALSVQNTKNATERAYLTQKILSDAGLNKGVALSMQSVDATTLEAIKRDNISIETYMELQRRFSRDGVETYSDLILGLPGETHDAFCNGVDLLISTGQHNRIQFNNLSILPNAGMGSKEYQRKYGMRTVESEIINIHGERSVSADDIAEVQELVIATSAMPKKDWVRTRAFCWMAALLHFDKLLQIPLMLMQEIGGASYRSLFDAFMSVSTKEYPTLGSIRDFFLDEARSIQNGGPEYVYSEIYLGIYWPADEYMFINLASSNRLAEFYREAYILLKSIADVEWLGDAIRLNRSLVKKPFAKSNTTLILGADIMGFYERCRTGQTPLLSVAPVSVSIDCMSERWGDLQSWCREVVWWGNKKGAYLYGAKSDSMQIAGHY